MADAALYNCHGEKVRDIALPDQLFNADVNQALVHQALVRLARVRRVGSAKTQTRSDIRRTGAKWYRQKGTGHARHGTRTAAGFVGGAKAHGPKPRRTSDALPQRMRRQALFSVLSEKRRHGRLTVLEQFELDGYSTKRFAEVLANLEAHGRIVIVVGPREDRDEIIYRSGRNIPGVTIRTAPHLSLHDALGADRLIVTRRALEVLQEVWLA
jgi:large subunit ribosomal protein L4